MCVWGGGVVNSKNSLVFAWRSFSRAVLLMPSVREVPESLLTNNPSLTSMLFILGTACDENLSAIDTVCCVVGDRQASRQAFDCLGFGQYPRHCVQQWVISLVLILRPATRFSDLFFLFFFF